MKPLLLLPVLVVAIGAGCTTKSKADSRARQAYEAGRRDARDQVSDARRLNIRVLGPVRHAEIAWRDGLTLAQVIAAADYTEANDPTVIRVMRQRGEFTVPPQDLLEGKDWVLEPGDTVELRP